jgi:pimeloyl-ACP methyl ester carboxylesterase
MNRLVEKPPFALSLSKGFSFFSGLAAGKMGASTSSARTGWGSALVFASTALLASAPAAAQDAPNYRQDAAWLCLPGRADPCSGPLATTALNPNGYGSTGQALADSAAKVDCFYVYPTVSRDAGINSDLEPGLEERATAAVQLARFGTVCRTYAPIYRQITAAGLGRAFTGEDVRPYFATAYADVLAAWRDFLAHRNQGRRFVLIGHSQGSIHLLKLLQEEIEGKPVAKKMLSAILLGWAVEVPEGKLVGGSLKSTPLCSKVGQTGCVITYMSFRASSPPPSGSFLGRASKPGTTAGCTNPAALRGGRGKLDSYWFTLSPVAPGAQPVVWSSQGAAPAPFLRTEGLVTGECRHDGQAGYLAVTENADPNDARTDRIPGDVYIDGKLNPGWGLHLVDMNVAQGDLIRLVEAQAGKR